MKNKIILYTNEKTRRAKWLYQDRMWESQDDDTYETMAVSHNLLNQYGHSDPHRVHELTEGMKLLLKMHGRKVKSN